jgi:hypothetical protein
VRIWQFTATNDATAPTIVAIHPANGATGVARDTPVVTAFSEAMDKGSAQGAFSLKRTFTGATVAGSFSWYGNALVFRPSSALVAGAHYSASVSTAAKDPAGNHLPTARTWGFRAKG